MARSVAPTLASYVEAPYSTADGATAFSLVSPSVSWQTNDLIVVICGDGDNNTVSTPTASGLTFISQQATIAASTCAGRLATARATSTSSSTISCVITRGPGTASQCGMGIWVWRGSDGVGASAEQHTTTKTVTITPQDTHSAFCWSVFDWTTGAASTASLTPTPTTVQETSTQTFWTIYSGNLNDRAQADAVGIGITGGPASGAYTILAQEVLGTEVGVPGQADTRSWVIPRAG